MKNSRSFFQFLRSIGSNFDKAKEIKADPEIAGKCKRFGVEAIITAVLGGLSMLAILAFRLGSMFSGVSAILFMGFGFVVGIAGVGGAVICLVNTFIFWGLQVWVNRKAFTWISLVLSLALYAAAAYAVWHTFAL